TLGMEGLIEQIGKKQVIEHLGKKRLLEELDVDEILANLPPAKRRELQRRLAAEGSSQRQELRTYHAAPRQNGCPARPLSGSYLRALKKHGMTIVGFWSPTKPDEAAKKLIYILAFPSQEAADKSWAAFRDDPEWKAVRDASEKTASWWIG